MTSKIIRSPANRNQGRKKIGTLKRSKMNTTKISELALIECLHQKVIPELKPGRLKHKLLELEKCVNAEFASMPNFSIAERDIALKKILKFTADTNWDKKDKHAVTFVSFLLDMIESSKHKYSNKITILLTEIFDYYERAGHAKQLCLVAGKIANEKWNS